MFPSSLMMIMMSGTKVFNKSAKRNFHQRESHDDEIATIYYYSGKEKNRTRDNNTTVNECLLWEIYLGGIEIKRKKLKKCKKIFTHSLGSQIIIEIVF